MSSIHHTKTKTNKVVVTFGSHNETENIEQKQLCCVAYECLKHTKNDNEMIWYNH